MTSTGAAQGPGTARTCQCGCGTEVRRMFAQGHDQILLARLRQQVAASEITSDDALRQAAAISRPFSRKVAKSMAVVADQNARTSGKGARHVARHAA